MVEGNDKVVQVGNTSGKWAKERVGEVAKSKVVMG